MATLTVCFSAAFGKPATQFHVPLALGASARAEQIAIPGNGGLSAAADEALVELLSDTDCWVAIGPSPDAHNASDGTWAAHPVKAGVPREYIVAAGDMIAVEAM